MECLKSLYNKNISFMTQLLPNDPAEFVNLNSKVEITSSCVANSIFILYFFNFKSYFIFNFLLLIFNNKNKPF